MITDSPYKTGKLVVRPFVGVLAGLVGAILIIGSIKLLEPFSNNSLTDVLTALGSHFPFLTTLGLQTEMGQASAGAFLLALGGCTLGYFYALSEQRIPVKGLIADGLFYGFTLWILGGIILGSFLGEETRAILRSWTFLFHMLLYGFCLSIFAVITEHNRPADSIAPRD